MRKQKVLIVDNDKQASDTLVGFLQKDYDCVSVTSGVDGLAYLENNPGEVDLIVTEMDMPMMSGLDMLECVRSNQNNRQIPVLILTSDEEKEEVVRALDFGVDDILYKPYIPQLVKKRVSNMMDIGVNRRVHNVMEDLVFTEINENITDLGICPCPICRNDLLTLTLNNVKPKYVSTEMGSAIVKAGSLASREDRIKLLAEITQYAEKVKAKPRHE